MENISNSIISAFMIWIFAQIIFMFVTMEKRYKK